MNGRRDEPRPTLGYSQVRGPDVARAEAAAPTVWAPGDVILGMYEVRALLGEGGMGSVHRVHHRGWDLDLAVKSPRGEMVASEPGIAAFVREAQTWVELGLHPHVVSCYYVRTLGGVPRVFAELVEGESLAEMIASGRLYAAPTLEAQTRVLDLAIQAAWGLSHAHASGLVHQDVKPANVMVSQGGVAKVTDFGLARRTRRAAARSQGAGSATTAGMTPAYASPEQAAGEPLTPASDVWSWAVSVLHMFAGEVTWAAGPAARVALESSVDCEDGVRLRMPPAVGRVLRDCLARDVSARPADLDEPARELERVYESLAGRPYPRPPQNAVRLRAASLNNRAISLVDLDQPEEARRSWDESLKLDPLHPEAAYNRAAFAWRRGEASDLDAVKRIVGLRRAGLDSWRLVHAIALIHLERGDPDAAQAMLDGIAPRSSDEALIAAAAHLCDRLRRGGPGQRRLDGHAGGVTGVSLSGDGSRVTSTGMDQAKRVWRTQDGARLGTLAMDEPDRDATPGVDAIRRLTARERAVGRTGARDHLFPSRNGRWVLRASSSRAALISVADGRVRWERTRPDPPPQPGDRSPIGAVAEDGSRVVWGDDAVDVWTVSEDADQPRRLDSSRRLFALSGDGSLVATAVDEGRSSRVRLHEAATGRVLRTWTVASWVECLSVDHVGRHVAAGCSDGSVLIFSDLRDRGHHWSFLFSRPAAAEEIAAQAGEASRLLLEVRRARAADDLGAAVEALRALRGLPGYERSQESLEEWRALYGCFPRLELRGTWRSGAIRSGGRLLDLAPAGDRAIVEGEAPGTAYVESLDGERLLRLEGEVDRLAAAVADPCGRFALGGGYAVVTFWELQGGSRQGRFSVPFRDRVRALALAPDGEWAAQAGFYYGAVRLWEPRSGRPLGVLEGHSARVEVLSPSPDCRSLVTGDIAGEVRVWDVAARRCLLTLQPHRGAVRMVAFGAPGAATTPGDGFSSADDFEARVWDERGGLVRQWTLEYPQRARVCGSFTADRRALLTRDASALKVWSTRSGRCLATLTDPDPQEVDPPKLAVAADGHVAVAGSGIVWTLDWELGDREPSAPSSGPLEDFLVRRTPRVAPLPPDRDPTEEEASAFLERQGRPAWEEEDLGRLMTELRWRGLGWLSPADVRAELHRLSGGPWPPPLLRRSGREARSDGSRG